MDFYLDDLNGLDGNDGNSPQSAWLTIEKAHQRKYEPGDRILFRRGGRWEGMFSPSGSGTPGQPITVDAYGEGGLPLIDGSGAQAGVRLSRVEYWTVRNIKVMNSAKERFPRNGIMVVGSPEGVTRGLRIEKCEVTGVHGENRRSMPRYLNMYSNSGIYVTFPNKCTQGNHLDDIVIEDNYVHDVLPSGIRVNQDSDGQKDIFHTNVVLRGNRIERTGADAIIVANCIAPLIEYNRCYDAGALGTKEDTHLIAGLWVCATEDAMIQYNEVARTRFFDNDGTAFDTDWGVAGVTTFQYNYSHENEGGFWLDCTALNLNPACKGTVLRGNISVNDCHGIAQSSMSVETLFEGNTFINGAEDHYEICIRASGDSHIYKDNVFCLHSAPVSGWQSPRYDGNTYSPGLSNDRDENGSACDTELLKRVKSLGTLDGQEEAFGLSFKQNK